MGLEKPVISGGGSSFAVGVAERTDNYNLKIPAGKENFIVSALYKLSSGDSLADRYCTFVSLIDGEMHYVESGEARKGTLGSVISYNKATGVITISGTMFENTTYYTWKYFTW